MDKNKIIAFREAGLSYAKIAKDMGIKPSTLYVFCCKEGITEPHKREATQPRPGRKKTLTQYRKAFCAQRYQAFLRGVQWCLTFEEWYEWWGDDIDKRGSGHGNLQMQRRADAGPYALWNIRKGYPRDNSATWRKVEANRKAKKREQERINFNDALMYAASDLSGPEDCIANSSAQLRLLNRAVFVADR